MDLSRLIDQLWPDSLFGQLLGAVVIGTTLASIHVVGRHLARIRAEQTALTQLEGRLQRWRSEALSSARSERERESASTKSRKPPKRRVHPRMSVAELTTELASLGKVCSTDRYALIILRTIATLRQHQVRLNVASLAQVIESKEHSRAGVQFAHHVSSVNIMLGVLGTFWGLLEVVHGVTTSLSVELQSAGPEALVAAVSQVRGVLSGMQTAFSTSVIGVGGAVVASVLHSRLMGAQGRLLDRVNSLLVESIVPTSNPQLEDDAVVNEVAAKFERGFAHLDQLSSQTQDAITKINAAQQLFALMVEDIRKITEGEATRDHREVLSAVLSSNEAVQELTRQLPKLLGQARVAPQMAIGPSNGSADVSARRSWIQRLLG